MNIFSRKPSPDGETKETGMAGLPSMTKDSLRKIIDDVDNDPLAGAGVYTKKEILVDRLFAHWRTVAPRTSEAVAAVNLLTEAPASTK